MQSSRLEAPLGAEAFLPRIETVFRDIDRAYRKVAEAYAFRCSGCEDSCCRTHFHHHTFLEFFFLRQGFQQLSEARQHRLVEEAHQVCRQVETGSTKVMCPLNVDGLCRLYRYRPMICRMHGVAHKLHHPVRGWLAGPGCPVFSDRLCGDEPLRLDRTPFYRRLARLEQELKAAFELDGRIRMTVAEMIKSFGSTFHVPSST